MRPPLSAASPALSSGPSCLCASVVVNLLRSLRTLLVIACSAVLGLAGTSSAALSNRPVPSGFQPLSFTAVSENDFWLLGSVPCRRGHCAAIVRTTDGGKTFTAINAPHLSLAGLTPELRFADRRDGFLFSPWHGPFFATHDGGRTWVQVVLGPIRGFATGGGRVYVVSAHSLALGAVAFKGWSSRPLPFPSDGSPVDLEAHGRYLWLLGTRRGATPVHDVLARSADAGRTFRTAPAPCTPGLGGQLAPTSATDVWAVCPTGMLAGAWHSTDGGKTFARVRTAPLVNAAQIAPASATTAVIARGGNAGLIRTTDGGKSWKRPTTPRRGSDIFFVGLTDARVGAALVHNGASSELWRTEDAGATWFRVLVR